MINGDHVDDESIAGGNCQRVACAEPESRPKPAGTAGRSEAQSLDAGEHRPRLPGPPATATSESRDWND